MKKTQEGAGLSALKKFKAETGLSTSDVSELLGVPINTISGWLSEKKANPPRDLILLRAVRDMRREYAAGIVKEKITKDPACPWCGEPLPITPDGRKIKSDHACPLTGYRHVLTKRAPDLAYRALTPTVKDQ